MITHETDTVSQVHNAHDHEESATSLVEQCCSAFDRAIKSYALFATAIAALAVLEIVAFVLAFSFLLQTAWVGASLALIFFSFFAFFLLRLYRRASKTEQIQQLLQSLDDQGRALLNYQEGVPEHHLLLARIKSKAGLALRDKEYSYYQPPEFLEVLGPVAEQISCWWHWEDLHQIQEALFKSAIAEYLKLVVCEPTNLEVHAALANAYVTLSSVYAPPRGDGREEERWINPERYSEAMQRKFRDTAHRAIEEFKILNHYAPDDPWIHAQLAYSYHDLQMPEEEIRQYETILQLRPQDTETLLKLGRLYFEQGQTAMGLQIYERLRRTRCPQAESLLRHYGSSVDA